MRLVFADVDDSGALEVAFSEHCLKGVMIAWVGSHDATNDAANSPVQTES